MILCLPCVISVKKYNYKLCLYVRCFYIIMRHIVQSVLSIFMPRIFVLLLTLRICNMFLLDKHVGATFNPDFAKASLNPRTDGGISDPPPRRFSYITEKPRREIWHDYSLILFTHYVQVVTS